MKTHVKKILGILAVLLILGIAVLVSIGIRTGAISSW